MIEKLKKAIDGVPVFIAKHAGIFFWLIMGLAFFNFFYNLGLAAVSSWDEAREGVTAYEMVRNQNFLIPTFAHQLELWNLKPPLGSWCIILGYKLFGFNPFGLRFFSASICLIGVFVLMRMTQRYAGKVPALLSGLILATTPPFVFNHSARSGDYSGILCCFSLFFIFSILQWEKDRRYLHVSGLIFSLSFLLYSFASFQLLVLMAAYLAVTGEYKRFSMKEYSLFFVSALLIPSLWAFARYCGPEGPAFLKKMVLWDLLNRSSQEFEGHVGYTDYYVSYLTRDNTFWMVCLLATLFAYFSVVKLKFNFKNRFAVISVLGLAVPLVLFSAARSKLSWYIEPIYPSLAIVTALLVVFLFRERRCQTAAKVAVFILLLIAICRSERDIERNITWELLRSPSQALLNEFKKTDYPGGSKIYMSQSWEQSDRFTAEVVCGLEPVSVDKPEQSLGHAGFLMLANQRANLDFVSANQLPILLQNDNWIIVRLS